MNRSRVMEFRARYPNWRTEIPALFAVMGKNRKKKPLKKDASKDRTSKKSLVKVKRDPGSDTKLEEDEEEIVHDESMDLKGEVVTEEESEPSDLEDDVEDIHSDDDGDEDGEDNIGSSSEDAEGDDAFFVSSLKFALASQKPPGNKAEDVRPGGLEKGLNRKKGSMVVRVINLKGKIIVF